MAAPDTDTVEITAVPAPDTRCFPDRANLWRACVIWQRKQGNTEAVEALRRVDPWQRGS